VVFLYYLTGLIILYFLLYLKTKFATVEMTVILIAAYI